MSAAFLVFRLAGFCIMPMMILASSPIRNVLVRKVLAYTLPLCLVWALVACITICASHLGCVPVAGETSFSIEATDLSDADCCPVLTIDSVPPERLLLSLSGGISISLSYSSTLREEFLSQQMPFFKISPPLKPPLERLCTLRI